MAPRTACAIALLAIGIALAAPARAEAAAAPDPEAGRLGYARSAAYGTTIAGFVVAGLGGFGTVGLATFGSDLVIAGALLSPIMLAAGPSAGHYRLGHAAYATATMLGTYVLAAGGLGLIAAGYGMNHPFLGQGGREGDALLASGAILSALSLALVVVDLIALEPSVWNRWIAPAGPREESAPVEVAPTAWIGPNSAGLAAVGAF